MSEAIKRIGDLFAVVSCSDLNGELRASVCQVNICRVLVPEIRVFQLPAVNQIQQIAEEILGMDGEVVEIEAAAIGDRKLQKLEPFFDEFK